MPQAARHILSYADHLRGGGVERAMLLLAAGWSAAGRRVTLVIPEPDGPLAVELSGDVGVVREPLARAVSRLAPDLVFCPGNHYSFQAAWLRMRLGKTCPPIVAKLSNALTRADHGPALAWGYRRWLRLHPRFIDDLTVLSPGLRDEAIALTGIEARRVSIIADPLASPRRDAAMIELPLGRFVLGVGRLVPQKRWDRLIAALPRLADRMTTLVILGEGPERKRLEKQAAALGVSARVWLPGHVADPFPALARATVVALTSDFEGLPAVLREALSVGTPVLTTESSPAIRDVVVRPEMGTIVPLGDPDELIAALDFWCAVDAVKPQAVLQADENSSMTYASLFDDVVARRAGLRPEGAASQPQTVPTDGRHPV